MLFNSGIWTPWLYQREDDPPNDKSSMAFQIYRLLKPLASPSDYHRREASRLFQDAIVVAADEVIRHEDFTADPHLTDYENSFRFVTYLLDTSPKLGSAGVHLIDEDSDVKKKAASLLNLNYFATNVHNVILGVAILDLYAKMPKGKNSKEDKELYMRLDAQIKLVKKTRFTWGCLGSFLISGVRGLIMTSRDSKNNPAPTVLAVIKAAADIQKEGNSLFKENIWIRTHDYIMRLLSRNYNSFKGDTSVSNTKFDGVHVQKVPLAVCLAYDIGHYWSTRISCNRLLLPVPYIPEVHVQGASLQLLGEEDDWYNHNC